MNILTAMLTTGAVLMTPVEKSTQYSYNSVAEITTVASAAQRAPTPRAGGPGRRELSVLTYNVHGLPWPISKGGRRQALRAIGAELGRLRRAGRAPQVVLIQEGFEDIHELVRLSGYRYWAAGPQRGDRPAEEDVPDAGGFVRARYPASGEGWGKLTGAGLHVLSDYPITEVEGAPYAYCAGWDCLANKGVMMVHIELPGAPNGLDVATTHLNSDDTAKVPEARTLAAHHLQLEAMTAFVARHRTPGAPLIVGGDFNTRASRARYGWKAASRPFTVVAEYCARPGAGCVSEPSSDHPEPWLDSEDLQAFADAGAVAVRPREVKMIFDGRDWGARLSDHDGLMVRYELSWP